MHMADALVSPQVAGTMYVLSTVAAGYSINKLRKEENLNKKIPTMGVMGAFVFATQMINFTIPGTGSSGHLCGGLMLSSILGPYAGFICMIGVLLIQSLFFADGGILALGANVWNMAFYGCFIGSIIWKLFMKNEPSKKKIIGASVIGSILTLQLGAFSVTLETLLSNITELPFVSFLVVMQPIHLVIGLVEGLITAAVLCFIYEARPEVLWNIGANSKNAKFSYKKLLAVLFILTCIIGMGVSLFASANPDGLEWSISRLTGDTEIEGKSLSSDVYNGAQEIQEKTAILPDYSLPNVDSENIGTSVSGIVGCTITVIGLYAIGKIIKLFSKKETIVNE